MKRVVLILAVVVILVLLKPTAVWADFYTVTGDIKNGGAASVAPFDSTKGTLTGVSWSAVTSPAVDVDLKNTTSQDLINVNLSFSGVSVTGTAPDGSTSSASGGSGSIHYGVIVAGDHSDNDGRVSMSLASTSVDAAKLSFYEGPGQPTFSFSTPTYTLGTLPAGTSIVSQGGFYAYPANKGTVTVTYTFTPAVTAATPEPSTLTLLGLGSLSLLGYVWGRRKPVAA